ncbi:MAG: alpha-L-fucosidase [Verrucomicrobia bacterium]|jgi:alpha-L-fucosidase|nr:alpha-L-fucosidase [Verrucomicrobiota bacterium]
MPSTQTSPDLTWFSNAKFGIFVHWGIYAVGQYPESWSFFNHGQPGQDPTDSLPYEDYMAQRHAFLARRYDPAQWAELFAEAGARYAVLTTKHHDGMALWDTAEHYSVVRDTPAGRDLVGPFCEAMRAKSLHTGLYYSHLDWTHPDYPSVTKPGATLGDHVGHRFCYPPAGTPDNPARWENFLRFHRLQLRELCERYAPDLLWFDGDWERTPEQWRFAELRDQLRAWRPGVILNSRMGGYGDYATPEQGIPLRAPEGPWELCLTMNRSWSMATDPSYKTVPELVRTLIECAGMGGNLLLNVAPLGDGKIFYHQADILRAMGAWLKVNGEAIYGTRAGLPAGHWYGPSTLSQDRRTLYLFQLERPWGEVAVKGLRNNIRSATVVGGDGTQLARRVSGGASWANIPGVLWLNVPEAVCQPLGTAIKLDLDSPLDLCTDKGHVITQN